MITIIDFRVILYNSMRLRKRQVPKRTSRRTLLGGSNPWSPCFVFLLHTLSKPLLGICFIA